MDVQETMSEKLRHRDTLEHRSVISTPTVEDPILVVCPRCEKKAQVVPLGTEPEVPAKVKMVCIHCGLTKEKHATERTYIWNGDDPTDGYFDRPLWMKIPCCGETLWAYNLRHLEFLEEFVSAELRERRQDAHGWSNVSLASRLPKWIQSKKNRKKVIECLKKLRHL